MLLAVVAATQAEATETAARLGAQRHSLPLHAGVSPLVGARFTACLIVGFAAGSAEKAKKDKDWWDELAGRVNGPTYYLTEG